ncbi:hypothetical protein B0H17DRAFT_707115 [Mycena rosella]|uniref:Protein kinase domain-containing protein n=1 Tax=Mycena rosella TaxID=1033263 RepID=A0AAD7D9V4_MYCRO|nr:hypothetical protein B0H17DRAFT_707115 [Mycena rosella]
MDPAHLRPHLATELLQQLVHSRQLLLSAGETALLVGQPVLALIALINSARSPFQVKKWTVYGLPGLEAQLDPSTFQFIQLLGKGGFGAVYKVWDKTSKQFLAVKVLSKTNTEAGDLDHELTVHRVLRGLRSVPDFLGCFEDQRNWSWPSAASSKCQS